MTGKEIKKFLDWNYNSFNHYQMHDKKTIQYMIQD